MTLCRAVRETATLYRARPSVPMAFALVGLLFVAIPFAMLVSGLFVDAPTTVSVALLAGVVVGPGLASLFVLPVIWFVMGRTVVSQREGTFSVGRHLLPTGRQYGRLLVVMFSIVVVSTVVSVGFQVVATALAPVASVVPTAWIETIEGLSLGPLLVVFAAINAVGHAVGYTAVVWLPATIIVGDRSVQSALEGQWQVVRSAPGPSGGFALAASLLATTQGIGWAMLLLSGVIFQFGSVSLRDWLQEPHVLVSLGVIVVTSLIGFAVLFPCYILAYRAFAPTES